MSNYHHIVILLPLIFTNVLHMFIIKFKALECLNIPIHQSLFGNNKTWRGVIFISLTNTILLMILSIFTPIENATFLGFVLGLAYVLFELPNSFLKRRLGIDPGESSKTHKILFKILDKTDSSFGVTLTYFLLGYIDLNLSLVIFLICAFIHYTISYILFKLKIKSSI